MRQLFVPVPGPAVAEPAPPAPEPAPAVSPAGPAPAAEPTPDPRQALLQAGVQLLEALAALCTAPSANGDGAASPLVTPDARTGEPVLQVPLPSPPPPPPGRAAVPAP